MPEVVVIGGGLSGLSSAYHLQELGVEDYVLLERDSRPGGVARSMEQDGYVFDHGPHILYTAHPYASRLIHDVLGDNFSAQAREAWIWHQRYNVYTRFPFQAHLYGLPPPVVKECLLGMVDATLRRERGEYKPKNYYDWILGNMGQGIADHLMVPYSVKLWTVHPSEMEFNWIARRVPTPSIERIVDGALSEAVGAEGFNNDFWYPIRGGIEALPKGLAARVRNIELGASVTAIDNVRRHVELADGRKIPYRTLVYTLPLPFLPRLLAEVPDEITAACGRLESNSILVLNLGIDRPGISDKHWIYFYEDDFIFHRISFPHRFSPNTVPPGKSAISMEIAYSRHKPLDKATVVEDAVRGLQKAGILNLGDRIDTVQILDVPIAYIIFDLNYTPTVQFISDYARGQGILPTGRFGEWDYFNMDHSILSGKRAAEAAAKTMRDREAE